MKATVLKQMYKINDAVEYDGVVGRIIAIQNSNTFHVLIRVGENTWKVEKWHSFRQYDGYLWTIQEAFRARGIRYMPSPIIGPMKEPYPYVIRLK
jgi:hypothetical protein